MVSSVDGQRYVSTCSCLAAQKRLNSILFQALVKRSASIFSTAMDHPFLSFFALVCSWVGFAYLLKKLFSSSSSIQSGNSAKSEDYAKKD